ncbi:phosphoethanolamine transferase [Mangrovibacter plantisponsor]|uniref:Glucan phosphoethanolaminetransferase (Alkaline phosphatase superfamily) n=1 Tax=Mangrovibacter plantisponsor TaxID=451513 RepID=A0A317Q7X6_9ENTR|nr:sulfatase-like hydrolase/transferase [Mangrovibacter plantisponsor]PWW10270.1 glucan phosphoethanolaminetransferase (alkaline phosphatase superfamily) [Mangrovibacter plantisponsor]
MSFITKDTPAITRLSFDFWPLFYFVLAFFINTAMGYGISILYACAFASLLVALYTFSPRSQKVLILVSGLLAVFYYPFAMIWGAPNFNTLLALHATNMEESTEILTLFPWHSYAIALLILLLTFYALRRPRATVQPKRYVTALCCAFSMVCIFIAPVQNRLYGGVFALKDTGYPVVRFVMDVVENNQSVVRELERMQQLAMQKDTWQITQVAARYHLYVLVIGESARRDALGAFGGQWDNTPFASHANGVLYTDYISASASTQKSLGLTLNQVENSKPQYQNNIVTLANRAGFQTWWFSNQGKIGQYDTPVASIARHADEMQFLKDGDFEDNQSSQDTSLLSLTAQVLAVKRQPTQFIVLHLMGSHPKACDRTQGRYSTFVTSEETSCYLQSITQTDTLLRDLYQQLQQSGESFSLAYFSDHGLTFHERGTRNQYLAHDDKFHQNYQVPFLVLSSDDKTHKVNTTPRSANDFLLFFSQWTGIKTQQIPWRYTFHSADSAGPRYVTNFKLRKILWQELGEDSFGADSR